jgi:hypothetical protein
MKRKFPFENLIPSKGYLWSNFRAHLKASLPVSFPVDIMRLIYLFTDRGVYQFCWNCDSFTLPFEVVLCAKPRHDDLISTCNECQELTKTSFLNQLEDRCIDEEEKKHYQTRFMTTIFAGGGQRQCIDCSDVALIASYKDCLGMDVQTMGTGTQGKKLSSWGPCGKCHRLFPRWKLTQSFFPIPMCPECKFENETLSTVFESQ